MFQILVVEDDKELRELFCAVLTENGYTAIPATDGQNALDILEDTYIDLIISDVMMPRMDGYALTRTLRDSNCNIPILMITARESVEAKHTGFLSGTDDYMVKPIDVNEMIWRVKALLRRSQIVNERKVSLGATTLDCDTLSMHYQDTSITLPQKEFFLLFKLFSSPNRIFTRRQIMDEIWGPENDTDPHTLEVHISRLREKTRTIPDFEIVAVRGLGYKVVKKHD